MSYNILNPAAWATFDGHTGKLSGFPDYGTYADISIIGTTTAGSGTVGPSRLRSWEIPLPVPPGTFAIPAKLRLQRMREPPARI